MTIKKTTIIIAEDHEIVRQGIKNLLCLEDDMSIVGEASNGQEALNLAKKLHPMVMIIDIGMPILNGIDAAILIQKVSPKTKIIMHSAYYDDGYIIKISSLGIYGYITKKCSPLLLIDAIRSIHKVDHFYSPEIMERKNVLQTSKIDNRGFVKDMIIKLSGREKQVIQLIAEGKANKQIANLLDISIKTVEKHRQNLMNKLMIHDTAGLTRYAISEGIIKMLPISV